MKLEQKIQALEARIILLEQRLAQMPVTPLPVPIPGYWIGPHQWPNPNVVTCNGSLE